MRLVGTALVRDKKQPLVCRIALRLESLNGLIEVGDETFHQRCDGRVELLEETSVQINWHGREITRDVVTGICGIESFYQRNCESQTVISIVADFAEVVCRITADGRTLSGWERLFGEGAGWTVTSNNCTSRLDDVVDKDSARIEAITISGDKDISRFPILQSQRKNVVSRILECSKSQISPFMGDTISKIVSHSLLPEGLNIRFCCKDFASLALTTKLLANEEVTFGCNVLGLVCLAHRASESEIRRGHQNNLSWDHGLERTTGVVRKDEGDRVLVFIERFHTLSELFDELHGSFILEIKGRNSHVIQTSVDAAEDLGVIPFDRTLLEVLHEVNGFLHVFECIELTMTRSFHVHETILEGHSCAVGVKKSVIVKESVNWILKDAETILLEVPCVSQGAV